MRNNPVPACGRSLRNNLPVRAARLLAPGSSGCRRQFNEMGSGEGKKNVPLVCGKRRGEQMLSSNHRDRHTAGRRAALGDKVPAAKRGPGAQRTRHHQTWALLTVGRQGAGRWMQGPICLKHTHGAGSGRAGAAHPPAGAGRDLVARSSLRTRSEERAGRRPRLLSQTQHRTFLLYSSV